MCCEKIQTKSFEEMLMQALSIPVREVFTIFVSEARNRACQVESLASTVPVDLHHK